MRPWKTRRTAPAGVSTSRNVRCTGFSFFDGVVVGRRGPEVDGRVGAKRAPRLRPGGELALGERRAVARRAPEAEVSGGERVRLVERAERDVVRRPRADAGELREAGDVRVEVARR